MQVDLARIDGTGYFGDVGEHHAVAARRYVLPGGVIQAQHHVLRRHDDRLPVSGRQDVVRSQHQGAGLHLRFQRQWYVYRHLVAVEVGVEGHADQRVQLDRLAFDQRRLKGLNAEPVQGRCAVQHHRMLANDFFENIPYHRSFSLDFLLRRLDGAGNAHFFETLENEGFEQFQRHLLRQAALMQFQLRAYHDDGATGVVHPLAQEILAEAATLALDHVGQRLQRTLVGACHGLAAAPVVEQRIDGLLQHAFFVAHDDIRSLELQQTLEAVVTVDHAAIQVIQVGSRKSATIEGNQGTQVWRQYRQHLEDHPLRLDTRLLEALENLEPLRELLALCLRSGHLQFLPQGLDQTI